VGKLENKIGDLLKSSAVVFVGLVFGKALGLLGEALIVRSLSPETYGSLALAYTITLLCGRIGNFGLQDGVTRLMSGETERSDKLQILQHGFVMALFSGVLLGAGLLLTRELIATFVDDSRVSGYLVAFVPLLILLIVRGILFNALRAEERSLAAVLSRDVFGRLIPFAFLGGALYLGMPTSAAIGYWIGLPLIIIVSALFFLRDQYPVSDIVTFRLKKEVIGRLGRFSLPLAMSTYIFTFLSYFDILMIGYFLESSQVGFYRAIQPLQQTSTLLMTAFTFLFLPTATQYYEEGDIAGLGSFYSVSTKWLTIGTLPIVLLFALFAEDVVRTVFGAAYLPAAPALAVLVAGQSFRAIVGLDGDIVKAMDRTEIELGSALAGLVVNVALNLYLIPRYGITGAAFATVVGYIVYNVVEVAIIYRLLGIHPFAFNNFKPAVVTVVFAVGVRYVTRGNEYSLLALCGIGVLFGLIALISTVGTKSLDSADRELLERVAERTGIDLEPVQRFM